MFIFGMQADDILLYREIENQPSHLILLCICPMNFDVKGSSTTMQARKVIHVVGMQVDNNFLYRGNENQPSPAYSSLFLSNFLSFHTLKNEMFRQRFLLNHAS